jgi:Tol biopolymer transport system component
MRDDAGIVQLFTVSPAGGVPRQVTDDAVGIASAFSWSPDGERLACVIDGSVCLIDAGSGDVTRLTAAARDGMGPRPEACVFSPDGRRLAYARRVVAVDGRTWNQIFVVDVPQ